MLMTKEEIKRSVHIWPANAKAPIDRDTQIILMQTAKERHAENRKRIMKLFEERKGT
jgi:hypothetical protein